MKYALNACCHKIKTKKKERNLQPISFYFTQIIRTELIFALLLKNISDFLFS